MLSEKKVAGRECLTNRAEMRIQSKVDGLPQGWLVYVRLGVKGWQSDNHIVNLLTQDFTPYLFQET
jgi:hypothetical protein